MKDRLDLHHGSWDWVCQRSGANELDSTILVVNVEQPLYQLEVRAIEVGFDKSSQDPFVQLKIQSNLSYGGGLPDIGGVTAWDSFILSSYDYFTGLFVMRGNGTYSGYMHQGGIHVRANSNKYLSVVSHKLEKILEYRLN